MADQAHTPDPQRPDLDESTNVTATHARVTLDGAAAAREKRLRENGLEPISLTVLVACAVVLLLGGAVLGSGGSLLSYSDTVRPGYLREPSPDQGAAALPPIAALDAYVRKGNKLYSVKCAGCHGADGRGDGVAYPPLAGSEWVLDHTEQTSMIILNGVMGEISVAGKTYNGAMPAQGAGMSPEDLASLMTYIRNSFGNASGDITTPEMASKAMDISKARAKAGQPVTASELTADHAKNLEGEPIDPAAMVDPVTLQPAAN
jgi:mono/diheme cytochrome c family protein